ncbi:discoidin domain-containing protein [Streptomyces sp. NBC_01476]|uniref:discoidin domain-containing protein n=1 Tax=Streptomyces sp. NBC_01476 TaxID=2903881 RepID=UPI002E36BB00|nr:discoidin domain-containing protein [Streptomyces sp. NBC_01476]
MSEFQIYAPDGTTTPPPTTPPPTTTPPTTPPAGNPNLAQGHPATDTGHSDIYTAGNAVDGNTATYWESTNNAFPQSLTVDLGATHTIGRLDLKLPAGWGTRTETLSVLGSTDNTSYTTLKASAGYTFNPSSGNDVAISFTPSSQRYVRLTITGNTGWPAGQLSEVGVYAS